MRTLEWLHRNLGTFSVEIAAMEREGLRPAECRTHVIDKFERRRLAEIIVESERAKIIRIDSGNEPQLHAATEHLIDNCNLLGQAQGMVERDDVTHRANAQTTRTCARADRITDSAKTSSSHQGGSDARHKTRNRSRVHRIIEALATVLHNADGASFLVWPRYGRNERTSSAVTLIDLPWRSTSPRASMLLACGNWYETNRSGQDQPSCYTQASCSDLGRG